MFPVHVDFHPDELLVSYASRLARANGLLGINDLFRDFEIAQQAFHLGESRAIERFAQVTGIDAEMARAQSFVATPNDSYRIAAQTIGERYLLRRQFRVCPACLRNDIGTELTGDTVFRAYARISWSLTAVQCCPVHHLLLVLPPEPGTSYDFCHGWEPWLTETLTSRQGRLESMRAMRGRVLPGRGQADRATWPIFLWTQWEPLPKP